MSGLKFNHVFAALLAISALCAFVIPEKYTATAQPQVQSLFQPVAKPVRAVAGWVNERFVTPPVTDARDVRTLVEENEELQQELAAVTYALDELRRRNADWENLKELREFCIPISVVGVDAGGRQGLQVRGSSFDGLKQRQIVLYPRGVVGLIDRPPGMLGAQVRLITDEGMRFEGSFAVAQREAGTPALKRLQTPKPLIEGIGDGAMQCRSLTMEDVQKAGVVVGAVVGLDDDDWDERVHGWFLGKVVRVEPQAAHPLNADIRIEPLANLARLREVMVLVK